MKILGIKAEQFNDVLNYMLRQRAYWYPQDGIVTYGGVIFKLFFIDENSRHISYLMMKYQIKDFTKLWNESRYNKMFDFMK